jgi:hypothetical protein
LMARKPKSTKKRKSHFRGIFMLSLLDLNQGPSD